MKTGGEENARMSAIIVPVSGAQMRILVLVLFTSALAFGQEAKLAGRVTDDLGAAIEGATVRIEWAAGLTSLPGKPEAARIATTDPNGEFSVALRPAIYNVFISGRQGFLPACFSVEAKPDSKPVRLALAADPLFTEHFGHRLESYPRPPGPEQVRVIVAAGSGEYLANARVRLQTSKGNTISAATTNGNGQAYLLARAGTYTLVVEAAVFKTQMKKVTVTDRAVLITAILETESD
jgi:hypothetical protein